MMRPTTPRMPPIISAGPLHRIRFEVFMTCQVSPLLWNAGDALEACWMDDAEDQVGNRLRPPPLSPRLVHPTGSSNPVGGDLVQVATSKPGPEDMIVRVLARGFAERTCISLRNQVGRPRDAHPWSRDHDFAPHLRMRSATLVIRPGPRESRRLQRESGRGFPRWPTEKRHPPDSRDSARGKNRTGRGTGCSQPLSARKSSVCP